MPWYEKVMNEVADLEELRDIDHDSEQADIACELDSYNEEWYYDCAISY